ncbi:MAG: LysM peptidoglycan-binding domain-containing protein [Syntrophobacterales bacterium]|nr:MAG: LysM peptidoglycan-binding domain-containing protein [Syntrophobacterales bacterium]
MGFGRSSKLSVFLTVCLLGSVLFGLATALAQQGEGGAKEGVYIIKRGDTLWDLSKQFLKDPFLWPTLWQSNQYITNPHWIYPGNPIRFYPFEKVKIQPAKPAEIKPPEVKPPEVKPEIAKKPPVEEKPVEEAALPAKPPEVALKPDAIPPSEERWAGFITKEEFPGIGVVIEPKERGRLLMAEGDIVYLAFKTRDPIEIGEQFTIFRTSPVIKHPHTGESLGRKVIILGECEVIGAHDVMYTAHIFKSYRAIAKGDRITHYRSRTGQ